MWLESEVGKGTTVHFTVRMRVSTASVPVKPSAPPATLHDLPVLIVDDNATNRRVLIELLRSWKMRPTAVADPFEALSAMMRAHVNGAPYRLVVLDGQMPEMDGFGLAKRIRADAQLAGTPLILLTSSGQTGDRARCRALNATYLDKPIMQAELLDAMEAALGDTARWAPAARPSRAPRGATSRALRILLAEDTPVNRTFVVHLLKQRGHSVVAVEHGGEAVAALEREKFDLILMDVQMPEMDGFEATAVIRERERTAGGRIPIVAMTAHAMKGDRERCLEAGMDAYVSKPIEIEELFRAIESVGAEPEQRDEPCPVPAGSLPALDPEKLREQTGEDPQLILSMVQLHAKDTVRVLGELRDGIARRDAPTVERAAHRLKSSLGTLTAVAAAQAAERLECCGREGNIAGAALALPELQQELDRLEPELDALRSLCQQRCTPPSVD
jgi:CheY-like chemotaxis protein/HPt (histidine-containing phosphotransfer) domain-containing protein